jgi:hypothetical protein
MRAAQLWWSLAALFALAAAVAGLVAPGSYSGLFPPDFLPGAGPQDGLTVVVSLALLGLVLRVRREQLRTQIVIAGLLGGLFYLYGIFVIERVYNAFYLVYLAAFASSFWSLVYGLSRLDWATAKLPVRRWVRRWTAVFCVSIAVLFSALWVSALLPLMANHEQIDHLYSIYILDLGFVMPALFACGVFVWRDHRLAVLAPALLILGFFVIFPLGLNELAKPAFGQVMAVGPLVVSFAFSALMLATAVAYLWSAPSAPRR